jgi:hypothetical protein
MSIPAGKKTTSCAVICEEAVVVGVCTALRRPPHLDGSVTTTTASKGADLNPINGGALRGQTGYCKGKGERYNAG